MIARRYVVRADEWDNRCSVEWLDGETRHYWAPQSGGYVRLVTEARPGTSGDQVMDARAPRGTTLLWDGVGTLAALMRDQMRALARQAEHQGVSLEIYAR